MGTVLLDTLYSISTLYLRYIYSISSIYAISTLYLRYIYAISTDHVHEVVERHLQRDVDHVVRVGGGQHVVAGGVVTQQVHRQLREIFSIFNCR